MKMIPALAANFLQIPTEFVDHLIGQNLSRDELLVTLTLARRMFDLQRESLFVSLEDVAASTGLERAQAQAALARACERGLALRFAVENEANPGAVYTLRTAETAILCETTVEEPRTPPAVEPEAPAAAPADPVFELSPLGSREAAPAPDDHPTIPPTSRDLVVWARVTHLLGRAPTKDEHERMRISGASDSDLLLAMDSVEARKIRLYTSDQILYEHDRLQRELKARQEQDGRHTDLSAARQRTRLCTKCGGSGYLFSGQNSVRACDCKK
ncbi:MAG: hypothetical protein HY815_07390 [Candidatus Riflebacteria bacterium]|nr:hypothetical protein [Candidatus Riflebacteria bacterium]